MTEYLVSQQIVTGKRTVNNDTYIEVADIIMVLDAETKEEAVGKFVITTQEIESIQRLKVQCYKLSKLTDNKGKYVIN